MTERVNRILNNQSYKEYVEKNKMAEADRRFCHHDMGHFLDVARLGMILKEKEGLSVVEELLYAAALLHDIGRWQQYQDGTPHEQASVLLAPKILEECGFEKEESALILDAIVNHRNKDISKETSLRGLLYRADKMSRSCFACDMEKECNWKEDKKNMKCIW